MGGRNPGTPRTALVTGGNRGIGFEACRQLAKAGLRVVLTARDHHAGVAAANRLRGEDQPVSFEQLDVTEPRSVEACATRLAEAGTRIDVLVNNAGIYLTVPLLQAEEGPLIESLRVNLLGAWRTSRAFVPGMRARGYGRVVNLSTGYAHLGSQAPQAGVYGLTKAALNALTRQLAAEAGPSVKVNALDPGWVATRMGGSDAPTSPLEATDTLVWLATLPDDGPTDGFFHRRQQLPW
jgi:NAD(P)-dependent dehydrogenase (short-subunit alcohol dehydrogenase family)